LDFGNFLGACEGGTKSWLKDKSGLRSIPPTKKNLHCGAVKANHCWYADPANPDDVDQIFDPRKLPFPPRFWAVDLADGELKPDEDALKAANLDLEKAKLTCIRLRLNVPVLKDRRVAIIRLLEEEQLQRGSGDPDKEEEIRRQLVEEFLTPEPDGSLPAFWTTIRAYLNS
jgi:hypothetical protein